MDEGEELRELAQQAGRERARERQQREDGGEELRRRVRGDGADGVGGPPRGANRARSHIMGRASFGSFGPDGRRIGQRPRRMVINSGGLGAHLLGGGNEDGGNVAAAGEDEQLQQEEEEREEVPMDLVEEEDEAQEADLGGEGGELVDVGSGPHVAAPDAVVGGKDAVEDEVVAGVEFEVVGASPGDDAGESEEGGMEVDSDGGDNVDVASDLAGFVTHFTREGKRMKGASAADIIEQANALAMQGEFDRKGRSDWSALMPAVNYERGNDEEGGDEDAAFAGVLSEGVPFPGVVQGVHAARRIGLSSIEELANGVEGIELSETGTPSPTEQNVILVEAVLTIKKQEARVHNEEHKVGDEEIESIVTDMGMPERLVDKAIAVLRVFGEASIERAKRSAAWRGLGEVIQNCLTRWWQDEQDEQAPDDEQYDYDLLDEDEIKFTDNDQEFYDALEELAEGLEEN